MKKQFLLLAAVAILTTSPSPTKAEETQNNDKLILTITATKTERVVSDVPTAMTVITAEEIDQKKASNVADLLRDVPSVTVVNSGGLGKATSVMLRGSSAGQVLIMIDGVQVNSPTLGDFNLASLSTANIEKIEILRGPQSSLYGSDAAAGVINIVTKKGTDYNQSFVTVEAGSFNTQRTDASIIGANGKRRYSLGVSTIDTDGISAKVGDGFEEDGYENTTMSGKFGYDFTDNTSLDLMFYHNLSQNDLDDWGGDTIYYSSEERTSLGSAAFRQKINDSYNYTLKYSYVDSESTDIDLTTLVSSEILTNIETIDFQNNINIDNGVFTFGGEYENSSGINKSAEIDHSVLNKSVYGELQLQVSDNLNMLISARQDDHENFGNHSTYGLGLLYAVHATGTTFKVNRGTGFKAPTFNDLFYYNYYADAWYVATSHGDESLLPEESESFDATIEQKIGSIGVVSVTYFKNDFKNLIGWDSKIIGFGPPFEEEWFAANIDDAQSKGYEFETTFDLGKRFVVNGNYTTQEPINKNTKKYLARRDLRSGSASLIGDFGIVDFIVTGRYKGKRYDDIANTNVLKSYTTVDATVNCNVDDNMTVFVRGANLNDKEYVEVIGYGTEGKAYYGGVKLNF